MYKKAANDPDLRHIKPIKSVISAYGGSKLPVIGQVTLSLWRDNSIYQLSCKLVDSHDVRPILGRGACLGMNIIKYTDNDAIYKPSTGSASVYLLENCGEGMSKDNLLKHFPGVLADEGWAARWRVPHQSRCDSETCTTSTQPGALRDRLKAELDCMVSQEAGAHYPEPSSPIQAL